MIKLNFAFQVCRKRGSKSLYHIEISCMQGSDLFVIYSHLV